MKHRTLSDIQPQMRVIGLALSADLPSVLSDLGYELERDSDKGWRIPGHGGLIVWKRDDGTWGWKHFSTGESGDAISFLTEFHGMSREQSINTLASAPRSHPQNPKIVTMTNLKMTGSSSNNLEIRKAKIPPPKWRENATKLVKWSEKKLHSDKENKVWDWLQSRGLNKESIRKSHLGWIPEDYWPNREVWGLVEEVKENGKRKKLWLPRGLLIPKIDADGNVNRIRIRRFGENRPKYYILSGSCMGSLILGDAGKPVVICEADLDAWLINQQASDLVTSVSVGSSGAKPDTLLAIYLLLAPKILISLDSDQAGLNASQWWVDKFPNAKCWPVPWKKDPAEAFGSAPALLRRWIQTGLKIN